MADTRERILDATIAVVSNRGLRRMSLENVSKEAGVSRQTVYRHFGSRDVLIDEAVLREEQRLMAIMLDAVAEHEDPRRALRAGLEACLLAAREHPLIQPLLETEAGELLPHLLGPRQPVIGAAQAALVEMIEDLVPGLDAADRVAVADAGVRLVLSHVITPSSIPVSEVAGFLADLLWTWLDARVPAGAGPANAS